MAVKNKPILEKLQEKFGEANIETRLAGLLHAQDITYRDYIHTETLLSLQKPRTKFPDEMVFIMYHQITELYFKLILWEIKQVFEADEKFAALQKCFERISRYFDALSHSFSIMKNGMEKEQYMQFRDTLTPASGFQSFQYRLIELQSTLPKNLTDVRYRNEEASEAQDLLEKLYWQTAGKKPNSEKKSPLIANFLKKHSHALEQEILRSNGGRNLWSIYSSMSKKEQENKHLIETMRHFDQTANITWVMSHYHTAKQYIGEGKATGGSDWQKYMHPKFQKRIFFPTLYTENEISHWGHDEDL